MRSILLSLLFTCIAILLQAQPLQITSAKFHAKGDNSAWKAKNFDDSSWSSIDVNTSWEKQNIRINRDYGWYRIKFVIKKDTYKDKDLKYGLDFCMRFIDDCDEAYLNGTLIGKTGQFPTDDTGYRGEWDVERRYNVSASSPLIKWGKENVLVVKVYNNTDDGGIYGAPLAVNVRTDIMDAMKLNLFQKTFDAKGVYEAVVDNALDFARKGTVTFRSVDAETGEALETITKDIAIKKRSSAVVSCVLQNEKAIVLTATYRDAETGKELSQTCKSKYILTPKAPATPRINNALVFGVRPTSPVILRIAATGERPMKFAVEGLPEGLKLDSLGGVISGSIKSEGDYDITLVARNAKGVDRKKITIKVGMVLALTPAMGWNSWNCWGLSVSQEKVEASAKALIDKGLADCGFTYMNIDDAWESEERDANGYISYNNKFKDMAGLGKWLHDRGLKLGIYSSPGDFTCGGYLGSLNYERQDAETYNSWGVDYLKYDFCGYTKVYDTLTDKTAASYVRPYLKMEEHLRKQPRDIFYSVAWGTTNVCRWAYGVDANCWRTTDDIQDNWKSIYHIGFEQQAELWPFAMPGHWNDPDMLVVGKVGWGGQLRDTRLTVDEQYTHISLWTLLASNMLIGCDIAQMDDFTLSLLTNVEVNAVDQDILGKQAKPEVIDGQVQIWKRPLYDGSYAVGIFNVGDQRTTVDLSRYFTKLGIDKLSAVRDLWRQQDLSTSDVTYSIPTHGVRYLKIRY